MNQLDMTGELTIKEMGLIMDHVGVRARNGEWAELNADLMALPLDEISPDAITTWARTTYAIREKLPFWPIMVSRYHSGQAVCGETSKRTLLQGLPYPIGIKIYLNKIYGK
jgi:hypothetical protein